MSNSEAKSVGHIIKVVLTALPWVLSMYTLYWLEYGEIWTLETPHRGKISVTILLIGMGISFMLYSRLIKPHSK